MKQAKLQRRQIHVETRGDAIVICPEGICDIECTEALDGFMHHIEGKAQQNIILDASRLNYIETPGFRWIIGQFRKLQELGGSLIVTGLKGSAERAFKLLQLDKFIPAATSVDAALARIRRNGGDRAN
ncbi:MAG: STAS domain-containing protein [Armatimonadetes bacterium]|nr:STAS domain-containing protein [Armatimonadota bacterium]